MGHSLLILGQNGQLARALNSAAHDRYDTVTCAGREQADMAIKGRVAALIEATRPDIVINAAAWTAVDLAEDEPDAALQINAHAAGEAAEICARHAIRFLHVSTDYVFGGDDREGPFCETDTPAPVNVYGETKRAGEVAVAEAHDDAAIVRTSGVFSGGGADFPSAMWKLAKTHDRLTVVADQLTTPSPADELAQQLLALADVQDASGIFHAAGSPGLSWAEFAEAAMATAQAQGGTSVRVDHITTKEFPRPAKRPTDSRLSCERIQSVTGSAAMNWRSGLERAYQYWCSAA